MNCNVPTQRLSEWVHGDDARPEADPELASHVATCAVCSRIVAELRDIGAALRSLGRKPAGAGPGLSVQFGEFRIVREIGRGGMGVVYEAEQTLPARRVALKVVRDSHVDDPQRRALFDREVRMLARLAHPGIASIYAAGSTPAGERFFAMELIEGVSLDRYATGDSRGPAVGLRRRVELMHELARAVAYAQQRGIVHRDLKPSNVLVAGDGKPKLLDFGLARLFADEAVDGRTLPGQVLGTPQYMSPEQARGDTDAIDPRTDVYALGVILYELLAGRPPCDVRGMPLAAALRAIEGSTPPRLRSVNPAVPRDLEWIAGRALERDPDRRFQSAEEFADDLARFLAREPIRARPAGRVYRLSLLLRRNPVSSALLGVLLVGSAAAALVIGFQALRIADERDRVRAEARKFAQINAVLENLWQSVDPWRRGDPDARVRDVLAAAGARVERELGDAPLLQAAVRNSLGNTYRAFGRREDFERSETHLRYALDARSRLLPAAHPDRAQSLNDLAETQYWAGRIAESEPLLREAIAIWRRQSPPLEIPLANSLNNLGQVLKQLERFAEARACYEEALSLRERAFERVSTTSGRMHHEIADAADDLAESCNNAAALLRAEAARATDAATRQKALAAARPLYERALALRTEWLGAEHPAVATMHNNLGKLLADLGEHAAAQVQLENALTRLRAGLGPEHQLVARTLHNLSQLHADRGDWALAEEIGSQALAMRSRLLGVDHAETRDSEIALQRYRARQP